MKLTDKDYHKILRKHRRQEKIRNFLRDSKFVWLLDPSPYESSFFPRSVAERYGRDALRAKYSWINIAQLQNEKALKAGLAGIITAPILASLAIVGIPNVNFDFPVQMAFIFASGLIFVIATALYSARVPFFVKRYLDSLRGMECGAETLRDIESAIQYEFLKLGRTIEVTAQNVHELNDHETTYKTAVELISQGCPVFKVGFDAHGQGLIERLLFTLAKKHKFRIFEEFRSKDGALELRLRNGPHQILSAGDIYLRQLKLELAHEHPVVSLDSTYRVGKLDLVLNFYDPYIKVLDQIDKSKEIEPYTRGLHNILREDYADTIVDELAYWQSWQRPFSRLTTVWLYRASLWSFIVFLVYQSHIVWTAVNKIS